MDRQVEKLAMAVGNALQRSLSTNATLDTATSLKWLELTPPINYPSSAPVRSPPTFSRSSSITRPGASPSVPAILPATPSPPLPIIRPRAPSSGPDSVHFRSTLLELVDEYETLKSGPPTSFSNLPLEGLINKLRWNSGSLLTEKDAIRLQANLHFRIGLVKTMTIVFEDLRLGPFDMVKFDFDDWKFSAERDAEKWGLYDMGYRVIKKMSGFLPPSSGAKDVAPYLMPTQYLAATMADKAAEIPGSCGDDVTPISVHQVLLWNVKLQEQYHLRVESFSE